MRGGEDLRHADVADVAGDAQHREHPAGAVAGDERRVHLQAAHAAVGHGAERHERVERDPHDVAAGLVDGRPHRRPSGVVEEHCRVAVEHDDEDVGRRLVDGAGE